MYVKEKLMEIVSDAARCCLPSNTEDFHPKMFVSYLLTRGVEDLVPHAKWKYFRVDPFDCTVTDIVQCSYCDRPYYRFRGVRHNFCPNCGAKMDLED